MLYLTTYPFDQHIVDIFANNSPADFVYEQILPLIFANPVLAADLKIIVTRGKIEGPLGQIHKLHSSGIMNLDHAIDLVLYTNDRKAEAIILLSHLFPELQQMGIRAIDDSPDEILPYRELARQLGIENLKLVHVRHTDAKRRDVVVDENENPDYRYIDPESGTIFDHYFPLPRIIGPFGM